MNEEEIKQKYMEFQTLNEQIELLTKQLEELNLQNVEIDISIGAVQKIAKTAINTEILTPIANGVFLKAELKDNQKMIVNVGSGITVEKTSKEVVGLLEEQRKNVLTQIESFNSYLQEMHKHAQHIYEEIEKNV